MRAKICLVITSLLLAVVSIHAQSIWDGKHLERVKKIITSTVLFGRLSGADFRCRQATGCAPLVRHAEREDTR